MKKIIFGILLLSSACYGQVQDAELWTGLSLKSNVRDHLSLKYETQTRFNNNASTLKTYYNEFSAEYEVFKNFGVGLSYRYSRRNKITHYTGDNRFCLNVEYSRKITDLGFKLKARARYQYNFDRLQAINDVIYPDFNNAFRLKLDLRYKNDKFKRILPSIGYELFKDFKPSNVIGINAYRMYASVDFDLPARHEIGLKYIYEKEHGSTLRVNHIYSIEYSYSLPNKLFDKKKKK